MSASLPVYSNSSRIGVTLDSRDVALLTFTTPDERASAFHRIQDRAVDLFAGVTVLLWRLSQHPEVCQGLDDDRAIIEATTLLVQSLEEIKGRTFNPEEFQ